MCGGTPKTASGTGGQIERARNSNSVPLGINLSCTKLDERIRKSLRDESVSCANKVTRLLQNRYACNFFDVYDFGQRKAFLYKARFIIMCLEAYYVN